MFSLLSSLCSVQHEYRFSLGYFLSLFQSEVAKDVEPPTEKLTHKSWKTFKVMEFKNYIFQAWKVMELNCRSLKVMEN